MISPFGQTTATGLSRLMDGEISHDQVSRMLASPKMTSRDWWRMVKPYVRKIEHPDGVIIIDDPIVEKPYTDENDIICWHYDHSKGRTVKGLNFITALYEMPRALPCLLLLRLLPSRSVTSIRRRARKSVRAKPPRTSMPARC